MRIRSIKPEFWRSEDIAALPLSARLTFIGLWSYVDDNGVGEARTSSIAADLYADDLACNPHETLRRVSGDTQTLEDAGLIVRYIVGKRHLLYVTTWKDHQVISRPSKGHCYPLPTAETIEAHAKCMRPSGDTHDTPLHGAGEQGSRGTGEQGITTSPEPPVPATEPKRAAYPPEFDEWWRTYPKHKNGSKKDAYAEWRKATKIIAPDELLRLTSEYADRPGVSDVDYCPDAHRWLKGHKWETVTETDQQVAEPRPSHTFGTRPEDWLQGFDNPESPDVLEGELVSWPEIEH
ncbi:hypothetical protein [Corynebacterium sp. AOP12-C2-36]|uniref:hypothetical protein n=1 Tax=Corynebacterium sp. AOP12-C2-36 TaxID=3457723 RepID=UPI0040331B38